MFQNLKNLSILFLLIIVLGSCKKQVDQTNRKILVFGNSMTIHPPSPELGWYGNWGMTASSREKDYIHVLESRLGIPVIPVSIADWEANHATFNLSSLDIYLKENPFIVVIRLGENVHGLTGLNTSLDKLVNYIQGKLPNVKILITGTFWNNAAVSDVFSLVARQHGIPFVKLSQLDLNENVSFIGATVLSVDGVPYQITNPGVAGHPNDAGMQKMADAIYVGIIAMMQQITSR